MTGDRLARRRRGEPLQDHRGGTEVDRGGVAGPYSEAEGHGYDRQEYVVRPQQPVGDGLLMKVMPTILCVHDAFGKARGPGGGVDEKDVVGAELGFDARRPGHGVDIEAQRAGITAQDQRGDRGFVGRARRGLRRGTAALLVADQDLRLRTAQYRSDLAGTGARADADDDGAAAFDCDEQHVDGGGVAMPHRDPITAHDPDAGQLPRQVACRVIEFTPVQRRARIVDVGGTVRRVFGVATYRVRQRRIRPPAGGTKPRRVLVGECRRAHGVQPAGAHNHMIGKPDQHLRLRVPRKLVGRDGALTCPLFLIDRCERLESGTDRGLIDGAVAEY